MPHPHHVEYDVEQVAVEPAGAQKRPPPVISEDRDGPARTQHEETAEARGQDGNAAHANACARRLADAVADLPDFKLMFPVEANAVFLAASEDRLQALRDRGWRFYTFIGGGARFMFAWDADPARVDALVRDIRAVSAAPS